MKTLSQILKDSNADVEKKVDEPIGNVLAIRTAYANRAIFKAAAATQLREFHETYTVPTYTLATIPLPTNFREFETNPRVLDSDGTWVEYEVIDSCSMYEKNSNDRYCYIMGNPASGYNMYFNNLIANATLSMNFQRYPSGLATLTDVCELSDAYYVVAQINADIMLAYNDERYQVYETEAQKALNNMIARNMKAPSGGSYETPRMGVADYRLE